MFCMSVTVFFLDTQIMLISLDSVRATNLLKGVLHLFKPFVHAVKATQHSNSWNSVSDMTILPGEGILIEDQLWKFHSYKV